MAEEEKDEVLDKKGSKGTGEGCTCRSEGTEESGPEKGKRVK